MLRPKLITPPSELPVSLVDAKLHLRVDFEDEDSLIEAYIAAATARLDGWSGLLRRCLVSQIWEQKLPGFPPSGRIGLPFPDIDEGSVGIQYFDPKGAVHTLGAASYHALNEVSGGLVERASGVSWPGTACKPDAVSVTFTAGFGGASEVPAPIRAAILLTVGHLYERREDCADAREVRQIPFGAEALIAPYRCVGL